MKIAGRCWCGMADAWVTRNPDEHMACIGLRWCGRCGDVATFRGKCIPCERRRFSVARRLRLQIPSYRQYLREYHREYTRRRLVDAAYRRHHNEQSRRSNAKARRNRQRVAA